MRFSGFLFAGLLLNLGCGGIHQTDAQLGDLAVEEAWYVLEIGGTPKAGQTHRYTIIFEGATGDIKADSLHFKEESLALHRDSEGQWLAVRQFSAGEDIPGGRLKGRVSGTVDAKDFSLPVDSIYMKERVVMP